MNWNFLFFLQRRTFFFLPFASSNFCCPPFSQWPTTPNLVYMFLLNSSPIDDLEMTLILTCTLQRKRKGTWNLLVVDEFPSPWHILISPPSPLHSVRLMCVGFFFFFKEISCFTCLFMLPQHSCFHTLGYTQVKPSLGCHGSCFVCEGGRYEGCFLVANSR